MKVQIMEMEVKKVPLKCKIKLMKQFYFRLALSFLAVLIFFIVSLIYTLHIYLFCFTLLVLVYLVSYKRKCAYNQTLKPIGGIIPTGYKCEKCKYILRPTVEYGDTKT